MKSTSILEYCKEKEIAFLPIWFRHLWLRLTTKQNIVSGGHVSLSGKIDVKGRLMIGMDNIILSLPKTSTWIKTAGDFMCNGTVNIHRGCRIEVAEGAKLELNNCFINNNCLILCQHGISIGVDTAIGWNTQVLDEDFHEAVRCERDVLRGGGRYSARNQYRQTCFDWK